MEYKSTTFNFPENQRANLKSAFKKKKGVTFNFYTNFYLNGSIQFYLGKIHNGKDKILLTHR